MEKDNIYFGDNGLTSTSANFIANQAKEMVATLQEELDATSFINGEIGLIGGERTSTFKGVTDLDYMQGNLDKIVKAHSLIAWLREAIKAKENLKKEVTNISLKEWSKQNDKVYPDEPETEDTITKDDILATWTVKDRNHYLALEAKVSAYGKFLHPHGAFAEARKKLREKVNNPTSYQESGRDTIIHTYSPSVSLADADAKFFELKGIWRKAQAELNGYEHKIQLLIDKDENEKNSKYSKECAYYQRVVGTLSAECKEWKDKKAQEIANLKIIIPHDLVDIYNEVADLSK